MTDVTRAFKILKRAGVGRQVVAGDELPSNKRGPHAPEVTTVANGSESVDEKIRFAITHRRLIHVNYGGRVRLAEPHDYGVKNGTEKLFVFQVQAVPRAQGKDAKGWRLLELSKIEACTVLEDTFPGSRGDSYRDHLEWDLVYARVT